MNDRFERLLKSRIGLDASSVGSAVIERAVRQRMSGLALHDEDEYWMRLNGSPGEVQALIEAVVVPETWFFRYPESFTTLARLACERQLAARGPSATVFYWLGLLSDVAGQEQEAQDFYRKALYLEPQHAEALAHLAALLAARGDHAGARRLQQRAARGVNKDG